MALWRLQTTKKIVSDEGGKNSKSHAVSQMAYGRGDDNCHAVWEMANDMQGLKEKKENTPTFHIEFSPSQQTKFRCHFISELSRSLKQEEWFQLIIFTG